MSYPISLPTRENWPVWGCLLSACLLAMLWPGPWTVSLIALVALVSHFVFFRDPPRVVRTDKVHDPYANRDALRISVFVTLLQVAGLIARRILCWVKPGDTLTRGQRYGLIRFGARVDVYLPLNAIPKVAPGDKVSATTTILATLNKA